MKRKIVGIVLICLTIGSIFGGIGIVSAGIYFDWSISATAHETKVISGSGSATAKVSYGYVLEGTPSGCGAYDCVKLVSTEYGTVDVHWSLTSSKAPKGYGLIQIGTHGCSVSPVDILDKGAVDDFPKSGYFSFSMVPGKTYYFYVFAGYYSSEHDFDVTATLSYTWSTSEEWDITGYDTGSALADTTSYQVVDSFNIIWQDHGGSLGNIKIYYKEDKPRIDSYASPTDASSGSIYAKFINSAPIINLVSPSNGADILNTTPPFRFSYFDLDGDTQYAFQLQIATDKNFDNIVFDTGTVVSQSTYYLLQPADHLDRGQTYFWRVKAQDRQETIGQWGDYSNVWSFTVINNPPTAYIDSITPNPAEQGEDTVSFIGHGSDSDGFVVAYNWNSSIDGQLSTFPSFTKPASELSAGTHTIYFKVQDDDNAWSIEVTKDLIIKPANKLPIAYFTYSPLNPVVNQTITFNASSSYDPDGNITSYNWNFGDGNITNRTEPIITHSYASAGNYTVNLTVTDNDGATNSTSKVVTVFPLNISTVAFDPSKIKVSINSTNTTNLTLDNIPNGLSGYNITISLSNGSVAEITSVNFPAWATLHSNSTLPADSLWIKAADLNDQIKSGATNITLATLTLRGDKQGKSDILITVTKMDDDNGNPINPNTIPGQVEVIGVIPFPGCDDNPPTDPDDDGLYEDINGNGRKDFNDIVVFFNYLEWVEGNQPCMKCFDFNNNGRIDFDDVVKLFEEI